MYDGVTRDIDFDDHLRQFISTVDNDELASKDKLKEFEFWFCKLALGRVKPYLRREDADAAFQEAVARLKTEYSKRVRNAEDMLSGVLKGEAIKKHEYEKVSEFILKIEEIFTMAKENNREADFDRNSIIKRILQEKLPYLKEKWAHHLSRMRNEDPTFSQFMDYLLVHMRAATHMTDYDDDAQPKTKNTSPKTATVNATSSEQGQASGQTYRSDRQTYQNQSQQPFKPQTQQYSAHSDTKSSVHKCILKLTVPTVALRTNSIKSATVIQLANTSPKQHWTKINSLIQ